MNTSEITYTGDLRTESTHIRSGSTLITDAPVDNNGKGEAFSPTDTVATALGSCMMTIMGIRSEKYGWDIRGTKAEIVKDMASGPRRINAVHIKMHVADRGLNDEAKSILDDAALNCPVAKSIHPDIVQDVEFIYVNL